MSDTKSLSHTKWNCKYHIVFAPKYRRQVFYGEKKRAIGEILRKLCEWKGVRICEAECCPDHIHMLLEIPPIVGMSRNFGLRHGPLSCSRQRMALSGRIQILYARHVGRKQLLKTVMIMRINKRLQCPECKSTRKFSSMAWIPASILGDGFVTLNSRAFSVRGDVDCTCSDCGYTAKASTFCTSERTHTVKHDQHVLPGVTMPTAN